jgi:predicted anti-sigma-YlaC factor YlaD
MLSAFESALLDRHLRGCAECRSFAVGTGSLTELLRDAPLEQPERTVQIPHAPAHAIPRSVGGVLSACLVAAAAAAVLVWPGAKPGEPTFSARAGAPVMVVFPAKPSMTNANVEVPRLRMQPASIADGPVHGYFSEPV